MARSKRTPVSAYSCRIQTRRGNVRAAVTDPRDTKRKIAITTTRIATAHRIDLGAIKAKDPRLVATPFPPRNLSQTGNRCPRMANSAAVVKRSCWCGVVKRLLAIRTAASPFPASSNRVAIPSVGDLRATLVAPMFRCRLSGHLLREKCVPTNIQKEWIPARSPARQRSDTRS